MQSDDIVNIRNFPLFRNLPWRSTTPLTLDSMHLPKEIEAFKSAVEKREGKYWDPLLSLYKPSPNDPPFPGPNDLCLFPLREEFAKSKRSQMSMATMGYLLLDAIASIHGSPVNQNAVNVKRKPLPKMRHLPMHSLESWSHALTNACNSMEELSLPDESKNSEMFQHFVNLHRNHGKQLSFKILANIETATMHLKCLLQGNLGLWADKGDLIKHLCEENKHLTRAHIEEALSPFQMANLRLPLHAALTLSPLCLIGSMAMTSQCVAEEKLCEIWWCLGGNRPALLKNTEARIWRILWDNATSSINLVERLKSELPSIVRSLVGAREQDGLKWFCNVAEITMGNEDSDMGEPGLSNQVAYSGAESSQQMTVEMRKGKNPIRREVPHETGAAHESMQSVGDDEEAEEPMGGTQDGEEDDLMGGTKYGQEDDPMEEEQDEDPTLGRDRPQGVREKDASGGRDDPMAGSGEEDIIEDEGDETDTENREKIMLKVPRLNAPRHVRRSLRTPKRPAETTKRKLPPAKQEKKKPKREQAKTVVPPYHEVIIILDDEEPSQVPILDDVTGPEKKTSFPHKFFHLDGFGEEMHASSGYTSEDIQWYEQMMEATESFYVEGKPRHLSRPSTSVFRIMDNEEFTDMTDAGLREIFQTHHIVVTGRQKPSYGFDAKGMRTMATLNKEVTIHDHSAKVTTTYNVRHRLGKPIDMANAAASPGGKILNCLDLPMMFADSPIPALASEMEAWTEALTVSNRDEQYPATILRWGLAATSGAYHHWHVDTDGMGTYVECKTGSKMWFVGRPKGSDGFDTFASSKTFMGPQKFLVEAPNVDRWDIEAVYLQPGSLLIMRPNTPHAVYTPYHAICHGGHFVSTATIRDTCYGIFHTFVANDLITNSEHVTTSRMIIRRIMTMYSIEFKNRLSDPEGPINNHVPDFATFDGILDVLTLHNAIELSNVINHKMYGQMAQEHNRERHAAILGRNTSRNLVETILAHYELVDAEGNVVDARASLVLPYLAQQAKCTLAYKATAFARKTYSVNKKCTYEKVVIALQEYAYKNLEFIDAFNRCETFDSFAWSGERWTVRQKSEPTQPNERFGRTAADILWLKFKEVPKKLLPRLKLPPMGQHNMSDDDSNDDDDSTTSESDDEPATKRRRQS